MINILIIIVIIGLLVAVHETGHFVMAKLFKVPVSTFAIGFPPTIYSFKKGQTTYKLNAIPLGGYVNLSEEGKEGDLDNALLKAPLIKQIIILLGGITFNLVSGFLLLWIMFMASNHVPSDIGNVEVVATIPGSVAETVLKTNDIITAVSIDKKTTYIANPNQVIDAVKSSKGKPIVLTVTRDKNDFQISLTPKLNEDGVPVIGAQLGVFTTKRLGFFEAANQAWYTSGSILNQTWSAVKQLGYNLTHISKKSLDTVSGPVGLVAQGSKMVKSSPLQASLNIFIMLSFNLALLNLIPIPSLDGGQIVISIIRKVSSKKIVTTVTNILSFLGAAVLILLIIAITIKDVLHLVK